MNEFDKKVVKSASLILENISSNLADNYAMSSYFKKYLNDFTESELEDIEKDFLRLNGSPEDFDPDYLMISRSDFTLLLYLSKKLKELSR